MANSLKEIAEDTNYLIKQKNYTKIVEYKERTLQLFYDLNNWMGIYEL